MRVEAKEEVTVDHARFKIVDVFTALEGLYAHLWPLRLDDSPFLHGTRLTGHGEAMAIEAKEWAECVAREAKHLFECPGTTDEAVELGHLLSESGTIMAAALEHVGNGGMADDAQHALYCAAWMTKRLQRETRRSSPDRCVTPPRRLECDVYAAARGTGSGPSRSAFQASYSSIRR